MKRLKYGSSKNMLPEEFAEHRRALHRAWAKRHPDKVRANNKKFADLYSEIKPFRCVCVKCGNVFYGSRNSVKTCPNCIAESRKIVMMKKKTATLKRKERKAEYKLICEMYKDGHTQEIIAETLGRSQSGVSAILRRLNKRG